MSKYLVIGGSSGIGEATVKALSNNGHSVVASYHQNQKQDTENVHYHQLNVLDENLDLSFIGDDLDGVVYCPGSIDLKPFKRFNPDDFLDDYKLQVLGAIKVLQSVHPLLRKSDNGSVVLISTVAVQTGFNFHSKVSSSKGALEGLTRALAAEFAPKVRVNAIAPSITDTPMAAQLLSTEDKKKANAERHPLKAVGQAENIARSIMYLLQDAKWTTGQILTLDGGISSIR